MEAVNVLPGTVCRIPVHLEEKFWCLSPDEKINSYVIHKPC